MTPAKHNVKLRAVDAGGHRKQARHRAEQIEASVIGAVIHGARMADVTAVVPCEAFQGPWRSLYRWLADRERDGLPNDATAVYDLFGDGKLPEFVTVDQINHALYVGGVPESLPGYLRQLDILWRQRAAQEALDEATAATADGATPDLGRLARAIVGVPQSSDMPPAGEREPTVWTQLDRKRMDGRMRAVTSRANVDTILRLDSRWKGLCWRDMYRQQLRLGARAWRDEDDQDVALWISRVYGIEYGPEVIRQCVASVAMANARDPLREYLTGVAWDSVPRLDGLLSWGFGADDTPLTRALGRRWCIQAAARALDPGCQADTVIVLYGAQGLGKSTGMSALVGREWFSDSPILVGEVRGYMQVASAWVHELGEMADVRRGEVDRVKQFVSAKVDKFVPLHARAGVEWPRRCVFVGSTNDDRFLNDPTGARRWWPVAAGRVDRDAITLHRDQIWAEAVAAWRSGERWYLDTREDADLLTDLATVQEGYRLDDSWEDIVAKWLDDHPQDTAVTTRQVCMVMLQMDAEKITRGNEMRAGDVLKRLGLVRRKIRLAERSVWAYVRGGNDA